MAKYSVNVLESAGRLMVRELGGISGLSNQAVGLLERGQTFYEPCANELSYSVITNYVDREKWLNKMGVAYRDADKTFNDICGLAGKYLINQYMKKHGLAIVKVSDAICPYAFRKVAPMKRKTTERTNAFGLTKL